MKPIFECAKCHFTFTNDVEIHDAIIFYESEDGNPGYWWPSFCKGTLKPVFYAEDLIKEIEELEKPIHYKDGTIVYPDKYISTCLTMPSTQRNQRNENRYKKM